MPPTLDIAVGSSIADNLSVYRKRKRAANRRLTDDPATTQAYGSITYDRTRGKMPLEWSNEEEFGAWLAAEESERAVELIVSNVAHSDSPNWRERRILRCSREWTGGRLAQNESGTTERNRKIPSKKTGCRCRLTIKFYRHTETILGKYENDHDHPLGDENLQFTRLSEKTRDMVMELVHVGIDAKAIVSRLATRPAWRSLTNSCFPSLVEARARRD